MTSPVEARILALERRIEAVRAEAAAYVRELLVDDGARFQVAERLPELGSVVLPTIHELLTDLELPEEVRALAALVGVSVGDTGPSVLALMDEIERGGEYAILAARHLAARHIPGLGGVVLKALRASDPGEVDSVVAFLAALRESDEPLPESDRTRLLSAGGWQVATALAENFPVQERHIPPDASLGTKDPDPPA